MYVETAISSGASGEGLPDKTVIKDAVLVLYFVSPDFREGELYLQKLKRLYPSAQIVGCTTGGEIFNGEALDSAFVTAAIKLEKSRIKVVHTTVTEVSGSFTTGKMLAKELDGPELKFIFVLSDGLLVSGSDLVQGITETVGPKVLVTGGLAGDGANFRQTGVGVDTLPRSGTVAAIGFYGAALQMSCGSDGGWSKFGPERLITRSSGNVLYELDGKPALDLYKKYLGEEAAKLPGSGLLFPLSIRQPTDQSHDIVRTIVGVDEASGSLIFAGDVPTGYIAQLMHGNTESLTGGAINAARQALAECEMWDNNRSIGILVSCIGRNLLMGQSVSNEIECVQGLLGGMPLVGFYSYGEICPHQLTRKSALHNQTMTITLLSEMA